MVSKKRSKIPDKIAGQVLFDSDRKCCVCNNKDGNNDGDQIHHLDGNPRNNAIGNLVYLCFKHHDEASTTGGLKRKLSKETIKLYQAKLFTLVKRDRKKEYSEANVPLKGLNEEELLTICKNAILILEIQKLHWEHQIGDWESMIDSVEQLKRFEQNAQPRVLFEICVFLYEITTYTRLGMPPDAAEQIFSTMLNLTLSMPESKRKNLFAEIGNYCTQMGYNIAYDACIHLRNIAVAQWGLLLMKLGYRFYLRNKIPELLKHVISKYDQLQETLLRPERNDLGNAQELVRLFREGLTDNKPDWEMPDIPERLQLVLDKDRQ